MKPKWLDRRISAPGPYLTLCLHEHEYTAALKHLGIASDAAWISTPQSDATAHLMRGKKGLSAVVCINNWQGRDPVEIAGLLVHEAVHIWQAWADYYGELNPGAEQEAYAIQGISQELMADFARRMKQVGKS